MEQQQQQPRKNNTGKIILFSLLGAGVIIGSVVVIKKIANGGKFFDKDNFQSGDDPSQLPEIPEPVQAAATTAASTVRPTLPKADSGFPLKLRSKGQLVRDVQNALVTKYGRDKVLTKHGVDGEYGTELFDTLISKGLPTWIDAAAYAKIMAINSTKSSGGDSGKDDKDDDKESTKSGNSSGSGSSGDSKPWTASRINDYLVKAIGMPNYFWTVDALKKIKNKSDYNNVNIKFNQERVNGGARKTIVNAVFDTFKDAAERKKLKAEFLRMGLKYDSKKNKWSLAGPVSGIKTAFDTTVWDSEGKITSVPANTYLGQDISIEDGTVQFVTPDGRHLFVATTSIVNL